MEIFWRRGLRFDIKDCLSVFCDEDLNNAWFMRTLLLASVHLEDTLFMLLVRVQMVRL